MAEDNLEDAEATGTDFLGTDEEDDYDEEEEEEEEGEEEGGEGGEEGEEGGGGEEGGEEEDGEYRFRFEGEMNPLDYTEDDVFGVQPYQQFERLEYEALAERKRKELVGRQRDGTAKKARLDDAYLTKIDEIMEGMNYGRRRKRKSRKRGRGRGRRNGSKRKLKPELTRKLGEANLYYAKRQHEEAIRVLKEVVMLEPNLSETYHTLGLVYEELGDKKKSTNFYMLAAHLAPKENSSLWRRLVALSIELGNTGQATHCLDKAIRADPEDVDLKFDRAALHIDLEEYEKAAELYRQIVKRNPENVEARKMAAKMYQKCNQVEQSIDVLEAYDHSVKADVSVISLLISILMETKAFNKALQQIEQARSVYYTSHKQFPMYLTVKAGICQVHLANLEDAEMLFYDLRMEHSEDIVDLITEVADTFMDCGHLELALKYYFMIEGNNEHDKGSFHLKIAQCYVSLKKRALAIEFFHKVLCTMQENIDARLTLASLLCEEKKEDEAIILLSPPTEIDSTTYSTHSEPWWVNGEIKMRLAKIYHAEGMVEEFVEAIFPSIDETLSIELFNQKVKRKKKLSRGDLSERAKLLNEHHVDSVFGFSPKVTSVDRSKALRARKSLASMEKKKAAQLAAGLDWNSDHSDDESPRQARREPPLPKLLKDNEQYQLIIDLCKALASLQRYWDAMQIIQRTLRFACNTITLEKKEEMQALLAHTAIETNDPNYAYIYARDSIIKHPYSIAAWNCYYKVISRMGMLRPSDLKHSKHAKFLPKMRSIHKDCVPPRIICGHQCTMHSHHQSAAREYLEAYKLQSDSPLINLCVGTALINITLGHRLQNKHQCIAQGLAFLYNNLRLCDNSQEALYNIARACHHVGLFTLAVKYYEKVLTTPEKNYPIPNQLPAEDFPKSPKPEHFDLRREAAFNLHLIYKQSGAFDLARQVLKDHCTP